MLLSEDAIPWMWKVSWPILMDEMVEAAENRQMRRSQRFRAMISLLPMPFFSFLKESCNLCVKAAIDLVRIELVTGIVNLILYLNSYLIA